LDFAYIYAPTNAPGNIFGPVDSLKNTADYIHNFYQNQAFACLGAELSVEEEMVLEPTLVSVYPNPAKDLVIVNLPMDAQSVQLVNSNGQLIQHAENVLAGRIQLEVGTLPNGLYIIKVYLDENPPQVQKVIISH
jgi:hypothetical protein